MSTRRRIEATTGSRSGRKVLLLCQRSSRGIRRIEGAARSKARWEADDGEERTTIDKVNRGRTIFSEGERSFEASPTEFPRFRCPTVTEYTQAHCSVENGPRLHSQVENQRRHITAISLLAFSSYTHPLSSLLPLVDLQRCLCEILGKTSQSAFCHRLFLTGQVVL